MAISTRKIDDQTKTVSVALTIDKGDKYTFGKLTIEGLDLNGEPAVRKLWSKAPGAPYNPTYPQYFLDRIKEDGFFDNLGETKAVPHIDEKTHIVDITLYFNAKKRR